MRQRQSPVLEQVKVVVGVHTGALCADVSGCYGNASHIALIPVALPADWQCARWDTRYFQTCKHCSASTLLQLYTVLTIDSDP